MGVSLFVIRSLWDFFHASYVIPILGLEFFLVKKFHVWCLLFWYLYRQYKDILWRTFGLRIKMIIDFFSRTCCDRTRGNNFKQNLGQLRLDIRKKCFVMRLMKCWNRLSREMVDVPSLETFKTRLDRALNKLI